MSSPTVINRRLVDSLARAARSDDPGPLLLALSEAAQADGGVSVVAKRAGLNRANLHEALAGRANPRVSTLLTVLNALECLLTVQEAPGGDS